MYLLRKNLPYFCKFFKYWIAYGYIDGFHIDTFKHIDIGATRYFILVIREFIQTIAI
jgi:glycosidase